MYDSRLTGSQIIRLNSVDSTNDYASKLLAEGYVMGGTVVLANEQTLGKGLMGNKWLSTAGLNLTFSLIIYPKQLNLSNHFYLSKITALAVSDLLLVYGIDNSIKWPNDIMTMNGKICGILIENGIVESSIKHSIIGVGLNVNQKTHEPSINATSMIQFLDEVSNLESVLNLFCASFDKWYTLLLSSRFDLINNTYLLRLMNFGKFAKYVFRGETISARITGVENNGILILADEKGEIIRADLKEIKHVF